MHLLIRDLVERSRRGQTLYLFVMVAGLWWMCGWMGAEADFTSMAFGISMSAAFGFGTITRYVPRPIWYLPVSRRDVFRANWLVHTLGATLLTTAAKLLAFLIPAVRQSFGLSGLALSTVFDLAYGGIGYGLIALASIPQPASGPWRRPSAILKSVGEGIWPLGAGGGMAMAGLIPGTNRHFLPTHWTDLTARSLAVLGAALAVTVATYFSSAYTVPPTPSNRKAVPRAEKSQSPRGDRVRLFGLPRLLVHEWAWTLMTGGSLVLAVALVMFIATGLLGSPQGSVDFLRTILLRFDGAAAPLHEWGLDTGLDTFTLLVWYALFAASLAARLPAMVRHLRVLPLHAWQVNALLVAWPATIWLPVWTGLIALHYIVVGRMVTSFHLPLVIGLIGASAVVRALTLRMSGVRQVFIFAMTAGFVPLFPSLSAPPDAAVAVLGVSGLAAAALLNRRSLTRNSTYKNSRVIVGMAPGAMPR